MVYPISCRVLHTLSRLSNSPKGRARIAGFPNQSGQANSNGHNDEDQVRFHVNLCEEGNFFALIKFEEIFLFRLNEE